MNKKNTIYLKKNISLHPFAYISLSLHNAVQGLICLILLQVIMLFVTKSFSSLLIIGMTLTGAVLSSVPYIIKQKKNFDSILIAIMQGLLIGFFLPNTYSPVSALIITFFTLLIYKIFFNEAVSSWINPVALTICVAWIIGQKYFPRFLIQADEVSVKNSSLSLIRNGIFLMNSFDAGITSFLNKTIFGLFNISIPNGYISLFLDTHSVIPAFRFNFLTVISSLFVFSWDMENPIITFVFLFVYGILIRFFAPLFFGGKFLTGDIILAFTTSGLLFSALFVLPFAGTIPISYLGKFIYGICAGIIAFFVVGCGTSPVGCMFTILIANIISPIIQVIENNYDEKKLQKKIAENKILSKEVIHG